MTKYDQHLRTDRFPRSSQYHPEWVVAGASGGANPLWLVEWLAEALELKPGMRVLDLGSGRALSSVFLRREFGVEVWSVDHWFDPTENQRRIHDAGVGDGVFALRGDARSLPFADEFFDAAIVIDSYMYYGTDDFYLGYLARFLKPGARLGIAQAGIFNEFAAGVPETIAEWWNTEKPCGLHSASWWRRHWELSGIVDVEIADSLPEGWRYWLRWLQAIAPDNVLEQRSLAADAGSSLGYVRVVGRRRDDARLFDPRLSIPAHYEPRPLLRSAGE